MNNNINTLIEENKGLVTFVLANYYPSYKYDEDFYQEGLIGLWNACKTYDEKQDIKFSTYAARCIRNHLNGVIDMLNAEKRKINNLDNVISLNQRLHNYTEDIINNIEDSYTKLSVIEIREYIDTQNLRDKQIIRYKTMGYSTKDIAKTLHISEQTVRRIWNKMRKEVISCT